MTIEMESQYGLSVPRAGKMWGMRVYPGGRKEFRQYRPGELMSLPDALRHLLTGGKVDVSLEDSETLLHQWKARSADGNSH